MAQIFSPGADSLARTFLLGIVIVPPLAILLLYAFARSPHITDQGIVVTQPVPFSHQHHVGGLGLDCRLCHTGVESSAVASVPATETCMTCHSQIWTNAELLAPARQSYAKNQPIHWARVHRLPDYVYFDHSVHVAKGVGCSSCHGAVDKMPLMRQVAPLTMGWCLDCHRNPRPNLRPQSAIFNPDWTPPPDQDIEGDKLLKAYLIDLGHLTNCTVCHR